MNIDLSNFNYDVKNENEEKVGKVNQIILLKDGNIKVTMSLYDENIIKEIIIGKHNNFSIGCGMKIE